MDILLQKEEELLSAIEEPTADHMRSLVAPDAISVDASGVIPVSAFYEIWSAVKVTGHSTSDMKVIPLGADAALVSYTLRQSGTLNGEALPPVVYATTAWAKRGGAWLAVFHQEVAPAVAAS